MPSDLEMLAPLAAQLAAVLAAPDDDAPRLVVAEHLEAAGHAARAELIRRQCAHEKLSAGSPERAASWAPIAALLKQHAATWLGELSAVATAASLERGFLEAGNGATADLVTCAAALEQVAPLSRLSIDPVDEGQEDPRFAELAVLARVRSLHVGEGCRAEAVASLLAAPQLTRLTRCSLFDPSGVRDAVAALCAAVPPSLRTLSFIGFISTDFDDACAATLAAAPTLAALTELHLWNCNLREAGALALAGSPHLGRLEALWLGLGQYSRNQIGAAGCAALAAEAALPALLRLDLDFNSVGDDGWLAMVRSGKLARFTELRLQKCLLGDASALPMFSRGRLDALATLDLSHNQLSAASAGALAAAAPAALRALWLYGNPIGDAGAIALAEAPWTRQLVELNLELTGLTDAGAAALVRSPYLGELRRLACSLQKPALSPSTLEALRARFGERLWRPQIGNLRAS